MNRNVELGDQAKKWVNDALLQSSKRSRKIVEANAVSLANNPHIRHQLQYGMWRGFPLLHFAARFGHEYLLKLLLEKFHSDPNLVDINGHMDSLRLFLKHGASIEVQSFLGMPIHLAVRVGNIDAVHVLHAESPGVLNAELYGFCTPLVAAAFYDSNECFNYLAGAADTKAKHLFYKVICGPGSEERSLERVNFLLEHDLNPNHFDQEILLEELPIICAAKRRWETVVGALLNHTDRIPGVGDWSVEGLIEYVNTDQFTEDHRVAREVRVAALKARMIQELQQKNYLAADLICKALHVDMDQEQWDGCSSLCSILIKFGITNSIFPDCTLGTIHVIGMGMLKEDDDENALLAAKACVALEPENDLSKGFLRLVNTKMDRDRRNALK